MRLYFEDPNGDRLALDTERREWAATYETDRTHISDRHFIIRVEAPEVLRGIEQEADFNGYGYNDDIEDEGGLYRYVYAEILRELTRLSEKAANLTESDEVASYILSDLERLTDRIENAKAKGYYNAAQYASLILILDDIRGSIDLYNRAGDIPGRVEEEEPPF